MTLGIALIVYFSLILIFLKNKAIELKYTLLWLLAGAVMTMLVIIPSILPRLLHLFGITGNMNGLFLISIGFLMILTMALTSIVSKQSSKIRKLTQEYSIMEREVRELRRIIESRHTEISGEKLVKIIRENEK